MQPNTPAHFPDDVPPGLSGGRLVAWTLAAVVVGAVLALVAVLGSLTRLDGAHHLAVDLLALHVDQLERRVELMPPPPPCIPAPAIAPAPPPTPTPTKHASSKCPAGYVDAGAFCVAEFEMKNVGGRAVSQPEGEPWTTTRDDAIRQCAAVGSHLITNDEWQELAHQVEHVDENWSEGLAGHGVMNAGNFSIEHGAADVDDPYATPGFEKRERREFIRRRTDKLPSGDIIWDLGGNVAEWTSSSPPIDSGYASACGSLGMQRAAFGPQGNYDCDGDVDPRNFGCFEGGGGSVIYRGGSAGQAGSPWRGCPGIFTVNTNPFWTSTKAGPGFRCVIDVTNVTGARGNPE
jgi:hypothetical protein